MDLSHNQHRITRSSDRIRIYYRDPSGDRSDDKLILVRAKLNKAAQKAAQRDPQTLHNPNFSFNPQSLIASKLKALTENPVIEIEQALATLKIIEKAFLKNAENDILSTTQSPPQPQEIIQIPPEIKIDIKTLINKIKTSDMNLDKELELSASLKELKLNDLAIQRLVKILIPDRFSNANTLISSRLLNLRHSSKHRTPILQQSIQAMNHKLEALLKTPLRDNLKFDDDYFHEELEFADLFSKSVELAPSAKERLIKILNQSSSFFDQKCVYDSLEKNCSFTEEDHTGVSAQIIREFKVPKQISSNGYNYAVENLTKISQKSKQGADLCLKHIENLLNIAPNTTTNLLIALENVNSLMRFRDKSGLTPTGQHWQDLVYSKLNNLLSSPHNEHKLSKFMSRLDLDLVNAKRLIPILDKVSGADKFHNIYQASLEHLNKVKTQQKDLKQITDPLKNLLKQILKDSVGQINLNEAHLQESLKYIDLFKPEKNDDLQEFKESSQIDTAIKFLKQAKKESSLGELLKLINKIFRTDINVDMDLRIRFSSNVLDFLERNSEPEPESTIQEKYTNWYKQYPKIMLSPSVLSIN
ncbi:MAG: hypothetical protein ACOYK1_06530 [Vampirovibrionia bacterium]|jgi:hypothetical protein